MMGNFGPLVAALLLALLAPRACRANYATAVSDTHFNCSTSFYRQSALLLPANTPVACLCHSNSVVCQVQGLGPQTPRACLLQMVVPGDGQNASIAEHREEGPLPSWRHSWQSTSAGLTTLNSYERLGAAPITLGQACTAVVCTHVNFENDVPPQAILSALNLTSLPPPQAVAKLWPALVHALTTDRK